jgi:hypothetical protein
MAKLAALLCASLSLSVLVACDGEGSSSGGGAAGAGGDGAGGEGAAGGGSPTSKPTCEGEPSGSATPDARADVAGAFAPDGRSVVFFGGDVATVVCGSTPAREHVDETWVLDVACGGWTQLELAVAPAARSRHAMALDEARGRALLFGGRTREASMGPYDLFDDVWAFDFETQTWAEIATTGSGPSPRYNATAVVLGDFLYVFGGTDEPSSTVFAPSNELFALDLATNEWVDATPATSPPARLFHTMAVEPAAGKIYVASGGDENAFVGPFFDDVWEYDVASAAWSELPSLSGGIDDPARIKPGLLAEPSADGVRLHLFGGHDDGVLGNRNDTNVLDAGATSWRTHAGDVFNAPASGQCDFPADFTTTAFGIPERRSGFAHASHPSGKAAVVFGGDTDCGRASDAWWYDAQTEIWEPIRETPVGLSCPRFSEQCTGLCG